MNVDWLTASCPPLSEQAMAAAQAHQAVLTKPAGSLGQLETLAIAFAGWQDRSKPACEKILIRIFAGDHGVCRHGVSAFPQAVTAQMIANFTTGGAAISVLARQLQADFAVVNMGVAEPISDAPKLINLQLMDGTKDIVSEPAMSLDIMQTAINAGREQVSHTDAHLFIGGDMGIGNTTSASALYCLLLELAPEVTVGPGTGVDEDGLKRKRNVLSQALSQHASKLDHPLAILQHLGGLEIAALLGAYIAAAQAGTPVLVDGFISTAAALLAVELNPQVANWLLFSHRSAEPAHQYAIEKLHASPLLDLGLRLGEGSGAAIAVPLIQTALRLHKEMATFADAGVSNGEEHTRDVKP